MDVPKTAWLCWFAPPLETHPFLLSHDRLKYDELPSGVRAHSCKQTERSHAHSLKLIVLRELHHRGASARHHQCQRPDILSLIFLILSMHICDMDLNPRVP